MNIQTIKCIRFTLVSHGHFREKIVSNWIKLAWNGTSTKIQYIFNIADIISSIQCYWTHYNGSKECYEAVLL